MDRKSSLRIKSSVEGNVGKKLLNLIGGENGRGLNYGGFLPNRIPGFG